MIYWWQCKRKIKKWYRSFYNAVHHVCFILRPSTIMACIKRNTPSERRRRKEIDRIINKGAAGGKLTPEEKAFLHKESRIHEITTIEESIQNMKELVEHERKYGPHTVMILDYVDRETGRVLCTPSEILQALEKRQAEEQAQKEGAEL